MLDHFRLHRPQVQRSSERVFGLGILQMQLEHTSDLLQGGKLLLDRFAVDVRQTINQRDPLPDRLLSFASIFQ